MRHRLVGVARHRISCAGNFRSSLLARFRELHISTRSSNSSDAFTSEPPPAISAANPGTYSKISTDIIHDMLIVLPDARFEVIGSAPYSLLSVSLSASQNLYTRRGTLVGVGGNAENVSRQFLY